MRKARLQPAPAVPAVPDVRTSRRPWRVLIALAALVGSALVSYALFRADSNRATEGMVWIPPGSFLMGSPEFEDAQPVHKVELSGFWMDATEVTNEQFAKFVAATGYKTVAERKPHPDDFPRWLSPADLEKVKKAEPFSLVFTPPDQCPDNLGNCDQWWRVVHGADWRHPEGPGSTIAGREKHPVVHVAWDDAVAYAEWAGKRLPTEAEWEYAARAGVAGKPYYWGDQLTPDGKWMANIWQGKFPCGNTEDDGHPGTAPVGSYPPNARGLFDMSGNVWEWCSDYYQPRHQPPAFGTARDPKGPPVSVDPTGREEVKRVLRGGSFLCSDVYCKRYMAGGRQHGEAKTGQSHTGFRCVKSAGDK